MKSPNTPQSQKGTNKIIITVETRLNEVLYTLEKLKIQKESLIIQNSALQNRFFYTENIDMVYRIIKTYLEQRLKVYQEPWTFENIEYTKYELDSFRTPIIELLRSYISTLQIQLN